MRACAELTVDPPATAGGSSRLTRMVSAAPLAWRRTPDAVYLVGTAATPVGDDDVEVVVNVRPGAALVVRSAAATMVWGSTTSPGGSRQRTSVDLGEGASLDWHPEPLIATSTCHHRQHVSVRMAPSASLRWTEEIVLGRHREPPGRLDLRIDIDIDGQPLLRHQLIIGPTSPGWNGPAVLAGHRATGLLIVAGSGTQARQASGPGWATMILEGSGVLAIAVAPDLPALRVALGQAAHTLELDHGPARTGA
jgi:urease accessory protein